VVCLGVVCWGGVGCLGGGGVGGGGVLVGLGVWVGAPVTPPPVAATRPLRVRESKSNQHRGPRQATVTRQVNLYIKQQKPGVAGHLH